MSVASLFSFQDRQEIFAAAIHGLADRAFTSFEFFTEEEIATLKAAALALPFRKASSNVGNNVHQDFDICFPAPMEGVFARLARGLEGLAASMQAAHPQLFESPVLINDFAVQHYPRNSAGIGIHKDALSYRNLVFIITLAGSSELFTCSDRDGSDRQVIADSPGRLVLLPAPGLVYLADPKMRPLHGVDNITDGRLSIGFRCQKS